jgi:hypothetical protein
VIWRELHRATPVSAFSSHQTKSLDRRPKLNQQRRKPGNNGYDANWVVVFGTEKAHKKVSSWMIDDRPCGDDNRPGAHGRLDRAIRK